MTLIIVHRLLQSFIFPPFNSIILIIVGLILIRFYKKYGLGLIISATILLYIQAIPLTAKIISQQLELPALDYNKTGNAQAIVILGGGVNANTEEYKYKIQPGMNTLMRIKYGAYLSEHFHDLPIIVSGGYTGESKEADVMRHSLITSFKVDPNRIFTETKSRTTEENAKYTSQILQEKHINTVILVTDAYHMRRAKMFFERYNINVITAPTNYYYNLNAEEPTLYLIPNAGSMFTVNQALHEIVGMMM